MDNFVHKPNLALWNRFNENYDKALSARASKLKPDKMKQLISLDKWYQTELPNLIQKRTPNYITQEEICKLMKWKLTRGKFRPRLTELVQANSEEDVKSASIKAFKALPDIPAAIQALTVLKAVGPATASAILAAGAPEHVAFMADESMAALPGLQPIKYDLPFYKDYMRQVSSLVKQLNKEDPEKSWTPHKVELTLWTYQMIKMMDNTLFQRLNSPAKNCSEEEGAGPPQKKVRS